MSHNVVPAELDARVLELLEKQLGRYQQIITRLAGNSVQVKTWCFTATSALAALAIDRGRAEIFAVALALVATFFYLDAYYLLLERHFRRMAGDLAQHVVNDQAVQLEELVVIAAPDTSVGWREIVRCGFTSRTSGIYVVILASLLTGGILAIT
jgi:hypothetical protein